MNYLEPDPKQPVIEIKDEPDNKDYTNHESNERIAKLEALNEEMLSLLKEIVPAAGVLSHTFHERVKRVIAEAESHEPGK